MQRLLYLPEPNSVPKLLQVADAALLARYQALLTDAERAHVAAAADPVLRRERLLARALVRTVLARRVPHNSYRTVGSIGTSWAGSLQC